MRNKNVKHCKAGRLLWIIPTIATSVTAIGLFGLGYVCAIQWLRTMACQRKAMKIYIEQHEKQSDTLI